MDDPYVYPGTTVLANLRNIHDPNTLAQVEANQVMVRLAELHANPRIYGFDKAHLRFIHQWLFQDLYPWAGEFRTVVMSLGSSRFAQPEFIESSLGTLFAGLTRRRLLRGLGKRAFAKEAAHLLAELNAIHPFREGNGRTQREFIRQIAANTDHILHWSAVSPDEMKEASALCFRTGSSDAFKDLLIRTLAPR